jgi:hypothetical protein
MIDTPAENKNFDYVIGLSFNGFWIGVSNNLARNLSGRAGYSRQILNRLPGNTLNLFTLAAAPLLFVEEIDAPAP